MWVNWEFDILVLEDLLYMVVVDYIVMMLILRWLVVFCLKGYVLNFMFEFIDKLKSVKEVEFLLDDVDFFFNRFFWEVGWYSFVMECDFGYIEIFWFVYDGGRRWWVKWDEWCVEKRWEFDEDDLDEVLMEIFKEFCMMIFGWKFFGCFVWDIDVDIWFIWFYLEGFLWVVFFLVIG